MGLNLVTLAEYKAYKGITSNTDDAITNTIIPRVSELVKSLCRRTFVDYVNDYKEQIVSGGYDKIILKETPLLSLSSLEYSSDYGNTYTELTEFTDFVVDMEDSTVVAIGQTPDTIFPKAINGYRLTYNAGYEVLPYDLKLAVLDLVAYYMKHDMSVHSAKAPGTNSVQIEYVITTALPAHIKRVLDLYTESYD